MTRTLGTVCVYMMTVLLILLVCSAEADPPPLVSVLTGENKPGRYLDLPGANSGTLNSTWLLPTGSMSSQVTATKASQPDVQVCIVVICIHFI